MSIGDVNSTARGSGARYNDGKVALELIPGIALEDCARVFDYGHKKYAAWNWAKGMQWMVPFGCLLRHMYAWARGEDNDPESGLPHLGHAMCNLVMLATFARTYPEGDDRPKGLFEATASSTARKLYDETNAIAAAQDAKLDKRLIANVDVADRNAAQRASLRALVRESQEMGMYADADIPEKSPNDSGLDVDWNACFPTRAQLDDATAGKPPLEPSRIATPAELAYLASFGPNNNARSGHPMAAEALRYRDEHPPEELL